MFTDLLKRLGLALEKAGLPYMVIGGQAVLFYGEPRLTRDIDITLGVDVDQLSKVIRFVETLNLEVLPEEPRDFIQQTYVLPVQEPKSGIRIDFVFSNTAYERQALNRVNRVSIKGAEVNFASIEDLVIHKLFAGRPRDLDDARGVLLKNKNIDVDYIEHWLRKFDETLGLTLLANFQNLLKEVRKE